MNLSERVEVEVYSFSDPTERMDVLNARIAPSYLEELRGNGGGTVAVAINDPKILKRPELLAYRNLLKVKVHGMTVGAFLVSKKKTKLIDRDRSKQVIEVSGEALRTWFNDATVHPAGGLRRTSMEQRAFNFSTARGSWYKPSQWVAPQVIASVGDDPASPWRYAPAEWPDAPNAKWVWSQKVAPPAGENYFRYEFTVPTDGKYAAFIAADTQFAAYFDGELVTVSDPESPAWSKVTRIDHELTAGDHVFAVRVVSDGAKAGFIGALFREGDATAEPVIPATLLTVTGQSGWRVAGYPDPVPGWSTGEILLTLMEEATARGVLFPSWLTPTFTTTHDSYGNEWSRDYDWSFKIGSSLADVIARMEELTCDIWVDPDTLELHAVAERGEDRFDFQYDVDGITVTKPPVIFQLGKNLTSAMVEGVAAIKNSLMVQSAEGWTEIHEDSVESTGTYGVVEGVLETEASEQVALAVAAEVFRTKAEPEEGASYKIIPTPGCMPFHDFRVGDWVRAPDARGELTKRRVMSLSVSEDKAGNPVFTVEFDTIFRDSEDRLSRWLEKASGGPLGGHFANSGSSAQNPFGRPVVVNPVPSVTKIPLAPSGLAATSHGLWSASGMEAYSEVTLTWDPVTANTDGTPAVPTGYEVWGYLTADPSRATRRWATVATNEATIRPFETGSNWTFTVRALNGNRSMSSYSAEVSHTMEAPTEPMDSPDAPTVTSSKGVLIVGWNGKLETLDPPPQFRYVSAGVATSADGPATRMGGTLARDGRNIYISGLTVGEEYWVELYAVDGLNLVSEPSTRVSTVLTGLDLGDLDEQINAAIDAAKAAGEAARSSRNMLADPSFEANDPTRWSIESPSVSNTTTSPRTGTRALRVEANGTPYLASTHLYPIPVDEGMSFRLTGWVRLATAGTAEEAGVSLGIAYGPNETDTSTVVEVAGNEDTLGTEYEQIAGNWTVPPGAKFIRPVVLSDDTTTSSVYLVDDVALYEQVPGTIIVDGTIQSNHLKAGSVTTNALAAESVAAEHIQALAVTSEHIRADAIEANHIAANAIETNHLSAGSVKTMHISSEVGQELNIENNESVNIIVSQISEVSDDLAATDGLVSEMTTYYQFGPDGAEVTSPGSPFSVAIRNDRIEMLENGVPVSYWNSGQMHVRSFVGDEVVLGNHQIVKYATGTVVRRL